jgi:hypothetical protein
MTRFGSRSLRCCTVPSRSSASLFWTLEQGTPDNPAIIKIRVHNFGNLSEIAHVLRLIGVAPPARASTAG